MKQNAMLRRQQQGKKSIHDDNMNPNDAGKRPTNHELDTTTKAPPPKLPKLDYATLFSKKSEKMVNSEHVRISEKPKNQVKRGAPPVAMSRSVGRNATTTGQFVTVNAEVDHPGAFIDASFDRLCVMATSRSPKECKWKITGASNTPEIGPKERGEEDNNDEIEADILAFWQDSNDIHHKESDPLQECCSTAPVEYSPRRIQSFCELCLPTGRLRKKILGRPQ